MKYKIDDNGFVLGVYTDEYVDNYVNQNDLVYYISDVYIENFIKPRYVNGVYLEGATEEDVLLHSNDLSKYYLHEIKLMYTKLSNRALSSSMGKYGDYEYLQIQKSEYERKYKIAKGELNDVYLEEAIVKEMDRDFSTDLLDTLLTSYGVVPETERLEKMYQLIIFRYEYALNRYNKFLGFLTDFRTRCITWVESQEWDKLKTALKITHNIPEEMSMDDAENLYNQFNNI